LGTPTKLTFTWPPSTSFIACALPLYGTWLSGAPAIETKSAPTRCCALPLPDDA